MGSPPRSPARSTGSGAMAAAFSRAAAALATGMTRAQPAPKAATTMLVARKTSTTSATRPSSFNVGKLAGISATWTRMAGRGLAARSRSARIFRRSALRLMKPSASFCR